MRRGRVNRRVSLVVAAAAATPAPTLSSVDISIGDRAGGVTIVLAGTDLTGTTGVTLGGTACTSVVVDSDIQVTCVTPAKALGTYDIVLTTAGGSDTLSSAYEAWDPSAMSPTLWVRGDYAGSPWADESGGGNNLTEATNPPAVGTALNGWDPADFDGANDNMTAPSTAATYFTASAYTVWAVFLADTVPADPGAGSRYATECLLSDSDAYLGLALTDSGLTWEIADGINPASTVTATFGTAAYHLGLVSASGGTLSVAVDNGTPQTEAYGSIGALAGTLKVGANFDASAVVDGRLIDFGICATDQSSLRAKLRAYVNTRYGLSV